MVVACQSCFNLSGGHVLVSTMPSNVSCSTRRRRVLTNTVDAADDMVLHTSPHIHSTKVFFCLSTFPHMIHSTSLMSCNRSPFPFLRLYLLALVLPVPRFRPRLGGDGGQSASSSGGGGGGGGSSSLSDAGGGGGGSGRDDDLAGGFPIFRVRAASTVDRSGALIAPLLELILIPFGPAGNTTISCGCKRPSLLSLA